MSTPVSTSNDDRIASVAKTILDIDELVSLLRKSSGQSKPWQRQLSNQLQTIDRLSQVLRMTISMDRNDVEVMKAVDELYLACRAATASIASTRADVAVRAGMAMLSDLAGVIRSTVRRDLATSGTPPA